MTHVAPTHDAHGRRTVGRPSYDLETRPGRSRSKAIVFARPLAPDNSRAAPELAHTDTGPQGYGEKDEEWGTGVAVSSSLILHPFATTVSD